MQKKYIVETTALTRKCSDDPFDFATTADLDPLDSVIGQRRAVEAIDFGLNMNVPGYHIFISGAEGTGKSTITRDILTAHAAGLASPSDLCLVNDFDDPYSPRTLELPSGSGTFFSRRMSQFVEAMKNRLPKAFEDKGFREKQRAMRKTLSQTQQGLFSAVEEQAKTLGIGIVQTEQGYQPVPVAEGAPVPPEVFNAFSDEKKAALTESMENVRQMMADALGQVRDEAEKIQKRIEEMVLADAGAVFAEEVDLQLASFKQWPQVRQFLDEVKKDMTEHILLFLFAGKADEKKGAEGPASPAFLDRRYRVNVLVDRRGEKGAPVVFEPAPTFQNLFGKVGQVSFPDRQAKDLATIQAGALLKANKGFLVLEVESLLRNPMVWETLKNTLQTRKLIIQDAPDQVMMGGAPFKSRPIPIDVKVILIGEYDIFRALQGADPKFNKIFKVRADFDHEADMNRENLINYARFIARVCRTENLLPFTPCGTTAVVEYGNRIAENKLKLSLRFGQILGVLKEADYWAKKEKASVVSETNVRKALSEFRFRHNLYEEKIQERYDDNSILIDVAGAEVGQVNALAVYQVGEIAFGRPSRITAESYMGKPGIINVEHEAQLSGQTHDKGVMIIAGYLGRTFAQTLPLSVTISVTFEQSYGGIDGDSASSTELYAVLSSLSGRPIRQGIAVTGSVNQKGEIQSIGGVNEKIEGYFDVCATKGLTGDQGVMIPASNVKNLMLRKDVVDAVEKGEFHIYRVWTIEEGIEVLTGTPAGKPDTSGLFPEKSLYGMIQDKLRRFHEQSVRTCGRI